MKPTTTVNLTYRPREAFRDFHARNRRFSVVVAHRRAGKTFSVIQDLIARALNFRKRHHESKEQLTKPIFAYVCPYKSQAKKVAWQYLLDFTKDIPTRKTNETELWIELPTVLGDRARIYLVGADNPDALRGLYFDGVVLDEYGDMKPDAYAKVLRPALADRRGWVVFMGTPKGKNDFYKQVQKAINNPNRFFYLCIKASTSGILSEKELIDIKEDMEPEEIDQELECSFTGSVKGTFYGTQMVAAEARGCIKPYPIESAYDQRWPVSLAMDLGRSDAAVIWFWQVIDGEIRFFDYWEQSGYDAEEVCEMLQLKPYKYETIWLPHDAMHRTFASKKSVMDTFLDYRMPVRKAPNPDAGNRVLHGIDAVRKFIRTYPFSINSHACARGVDVLKNYHRKYNRSAGVFMTEADHDEWSHGADAFRYAVLSINPNVIPLSVERAKALREMEKNRPAFSMNQNMSAVQVNTGRQTLDQAFAERDRLSRLRARQGRNI